MRIQPVVPGTREELKEQEAQILAQRGRISPLYQALLNSPPIAHGWEQMLSAVRNRSSLADALRELVILRVAVLNHAPFEFEAHAPIALRSGVTQQAIDQLKNAAYDKDHASLQVLSHLFTPEQLVALKLTDTMTKEITVPDDLYAQVRRHFNDQQQVDLVATAAAYNMVSRFLEALQIGH
jgi:4-carboxymuconolactone decarboxylase